MPRCPTQDTQYITKIMAFQDSSKTAFTKHITYNAQTMSLIGVFVPCFRFPFPCCNFCSVLQMSSIWYVIYAVLHGGHNGICADIAVDRFLKIHAHQFHTIILGTAKCSNNLHINSLVTANQSPDSTNDNVVYSRIAVTHNRWGEFASLYHVLAFFFLAATSILFFQSRPHDTDYTQFCTAVTTVYVPIS